MKQESSQFCKFLHLFRTFFQVKKVHSTGGYGSQGYGYDWKIEEAKKNLLRTHTTAVSARMLYKLAQVLIFVCLKFWFVNLKSNCFFISLLILFELNLLRNNLANRNVNLILINLREKEI